MKIEVLLTEAEIAQEFSEAITARDLPEKFFYHFPLSVREWMALSSGPGYDGLRQTWTALAARAASALPKGGEALPIISFGAGDGSRDLLLVEALQKSGRGVQYFPVDASQSLLETACAAAEDLDVEALGIKADISSPTHLVLAADAAEPPRLFLMTGNTMAGFDPLDEIRQLASCLHEGDRLIVDAELYSPEALERHSPAKLQPFVFAPLASIGITAEDGEVAFEHRRDERHDGLHLITRQFRVDRDINAFFASQPIALEGGERIGMNFQYLYTAEAFRWLVQQHARLRILEEVQSADGSFLTCICVR